MKPLALALAFNHARKAALSGATAAALIWLPMAAMAQQGTALTFAGLRQDRSVPVEIEATTLEVNERTGLAVFSGDVVVTQGDLVLQAPRVEVEGDPDRGGEGIREVRAAGGVSLRSISETARGDEAVYDVASGLLRLEGNVVLTQGSSTLSGQRLLANLNDGTGVMEGRVRTVFQPDQGRSGAK